MTDNEIIKSVELCLANDIIQSKCEKCKYKTDGASCMDNMLRDILDLINRQKTEIERLEREIDGLESVQEISPEAKHFVDTKADKVISLLNEVIKSQEQIKSEARKEFAERLKKKARKLTEYDEGGWDMDVHAVEVSEIDNLLEEMENET